MIAMHVIILHVKIFASVALAMCFSLVARNATVVFIVPLCRCSLHWGRGLLWRPRPNGRHALKLHDLPMAGRTRAVDDFVRFLHQSRDHALLP